MELLNSKTVVLGCEAEPAPTWLDQMAPLIGMVLAVTILGALVESMTAGGG